MSTQNYLFNGKTYTAETLLSETTTGSSLVELYNSLQAAMNSSQRVSRFSDKSTAATRCLKALREFEAYYAQNIQGVFPTEEAAPADYVAVPMTESAWVLEPTLTEEPEEVEETSTPEPAAEEAPVKVRSFAGLSRIPTGERTVAEKAAKVRKGTDLKPTGKPLEACRLGSKQALLRDCLMVAGGVTMEGLLEALSGGRKPWVEATVRSGFGWDMKRKGYGVKSEYDADGVERFHLVWPEDQTPPDHYGFANTSDHITL